MIDTYKLASCLLCRTTVFVPKEDNGTQLCIDHHKSMSKRVARAIARTDEATLRRRVEAYEDILSGL